MPQYLHKYTHGRQAERAQERGREILRTNGHTGTSFLIPHPCIRFDWLKSLKTNWFAETIKSCLSQPDNAAFSWKALAEMHASPGFTHLENRSPHSLLLPLLLQQMTLHQSQGRARPSSDTSPLDNGLARWWDGVRPAMEALMLSSLHLLHRVRFNTSSYCGEACSKCFKSLLVFPHKDNDR